MVPRNKEGPLLGLGDSSFREISASESVDGLSLPLVHGRLWPLWPLSIPVLLFWALFQEAVTFPSQIPEGEFSLDHPEGGRPWR